MSSRVINIPPRENRKSKEAWALIDSTIPSKIEHSGAYVYHDYSECIDIACPTNRKINFCSTSYLGLNQDPRMKQAAYEAIEQYGLSPLGSAPFGGLTNLHEKLGYRLGKIYGLPYGITTSGATLANMTIIPLIVGAKDFVFSDELNHTTIIDGIDLSKAKMIKYKHNDMEDLEKNVKLIHEKFPNSVKLIIFDGVFSMEGDVCDLPNIVRIAKKYNCKTMIDECHALGIIGPHGYGTLDYFNMPGSVDFVTGTLVKSLCSHGGYICCRRDYQNKLENSSGIIFSTNNTPAYAATSLKALDLIEEEGPNSVRARLQRNVKHWKEGVRNLGFEIIEGVSCVCPIMIYDEINGLKFQKRLYEEGLNFSAVAFPAVPKNMARLRTTVLGSLTDEDIDEALSILGRVAQQEFPQILVNGSTKIYPALPNPLKPRIPEFDTYEKKSYLHPINKPKYAVIGVGCRFPGNIKSKEDFWEMLTSGRCLTSEIPNDRWNTAEWYNKEPKRGTMQTTRGAFMEDAFYFDNKYFSISQNEAKEMSPEQRWLMELAVETFEDANINPKKLKGSRTGVFVGSSGMDFVSAQISHANDLTQHSATGLELSILANRISYFFDLNGPSICTNTACSASMTALNLAINSMITDDCDAALVAGTNLLFTPGSYVAYSQLRVVSTDGSCKPFDKNADGYSRIEGAGMILIKPYEKAVKDGDKIYCAILGSGTNEDGHTPSLTMPSYSSQCKLLTHVCEKFDIDPASIDYVEAHGTGTAVGDPIEARSIGYAYGRRVREGKQIKTTRPGETEEILDQPTFPLLIGSSKGNTGHGEYSSGIIGMIKAILMLYHRTMVPTIAHKEMNPAIDAEGLGIKVATKLEPWTTPHTLRIAVNSFGFGGSNGNAIFEEVVNEKPEDFSMKIKDPKNPVVATFSAYDEKTLQNLLKKWSTEVPNETLLQELFVISQCHESESMRSAMIFSSVDEAKALIEEMRNGNVEKFKRHEKIYMKRVKINEKPGINFAFSGQGSQFINMGRRMYQVNGLFKRIVDYCAAVLVTYNGGEDIFEKYHIFKGDVSQISEADLSLPQYSILAIGVAQIALTEIWKAMGVTPEAVFGHSMGEVAAAYAAGILTLEDAILLLYMRGHILAQLDGTGKGMLALGCSVEQAQYFMNNKPNVFISAVNSANSITLAGDISQINAIAQEAKAQNLFAVVLKVKQAFHSPYVEGAEQAFKESIRGISERTSAPKCKFISACFGQEYEGPFDENYWWANIRNPVSFYAAASIGTQFSKRVLEIGAHPVLSVYLKEIYGKEYVYQSLSRKMDDVDSMCRTTAALFIDNAVEFMDYTQIWEGKVDLQRVKTGDVVPLKKLRSINFSIPKHVWNRKAIRKEYTDRFGTDSNHEIYTTREFVLKEMGLSEDDLKLLKNIKSGKVAPAAGAANETSFTVQSPVSIAKPKPKPKVVPQLPKATFIPTNANVIYSSGNQWNFENHRYLQDHVVNKKIVLPAAGSVSRAFSGFATAHPLKVAQRAIISLEDLKFDRMGIFDKTIDFNTATGPMPITYEEERSNQTYKIIFNEDVEVSSGKFNNNDETETLKNIPAVDYFINQCSSIAGGQGVTPAMFYNRTQEIGLDYGEEFRLYKAIRSGKNVAYGKLTVSKEHQKMVCHPAVLDNCIQIVFASGVAAGDCQALPVGMKKVVLSQGGHFPEGTLIVATELVKQDIKECVSNVYIYDENKNIFGYVEGLTMSFRRSRAEKAIDWIHVLGFEEKAPTANEYLPVDCRNVIVMCTETQQDEANAFATHIGSVVAGLQNIWVLPGNYIENIQQMVENKMIKPKETFIIDASFIDSPEIDRAFMILKTVVNYEIPTLFAASKYIKDESAQSHAVATSKAVIGMVRAARAECKVPLFTAHTDKFEDLYLAALRSGLTMDDPEVEIIDGKVQCVRFIKLDKEPVVKSSNIKLERSANGQIGQMKYSECIGLPAYTDDEVVIKVKGVSMQFKDIMTAMDALIGFDSYEPGMECIGRVVAIGKNVASNPRNQLQIGDPVIAFSHKYGHLLRTYGVVDPLSLQKIPESMYKVEYAGIFIVFITAYYSLHVRAGGIKPGQTILIHAAAGGVGQAAVKLCQLWGANIIASASASKQQFLRDTYGLEHVTNSRDPEEFYRDVMKWTDGKGVDFVLNSLSGKSLKMGIKCLKNGGKFVEIGKTDILNDSKLGLHCLLNNISFVSSHIDLLNNQQMNYYKNILFEMFSTGKLTPIPAKIFPGNKYKEAFFYLASGRNIGKTCIEFEDNMSYECTPVTLIDPNLTYLITGAFGGVGLRVVLWLVSRGAKNILLTTSSSVEKQYEQPIIRSLLEKGINVMIKTCDITDLTSVQQLFQQTTPRIAGVFHLANRFAPGLISTSDLALLRKGFSAKAEGAWNLHLVTLQKAHQVQLFVVFSSILDVLGNRGQTAYGAANAFLSSIVDHRREKGLSGNCIALPAMRGSGYLAKWNQTKQSKDFEQLIALLDTDELVNVMDGLIRYDLPANIYMAKNWANMSYDATFVAPVTRSISHLRGVNPVPVVTFPTEKKLDLPSLIRNCGGHYIAEPTHIPRSSATTTSSVRSFTPVAVKSFSPVPVSPVPVSVRTFTQDSVAPAVQVRSFQPTSLATPVAVQARYTPAPAPVPVPASVPVADAKPISSLNKNKLTKDITDKLQSMLGLIDEEIDVTIPLRVYGLDSLTAMELTKWIESEMNIEFSQSQLLGDDITTEDLINIIMDGSSSAPVTESTPVAPAPEAPVVAPITQTRTFQPTPVAAPVAPVAVQTRSFQPTPVVAPVAPVAVQVRSAPVSAPVAAAKPTSGLNRDKLTKDITEKLQSMLGLIDEEIDVTIPLRVYGLDSLTAMELTKWIESEMNIEFSQSQLLGDDITTEDLINIIMDGSSSAPVTESTPVAPAPEAPVVAPITQTRTFQPTPVAAPVAPVAVQTRSFQQAPVATPVAPVAVQTRTFQPTPVAAPVAVQARSTSVPAPAPVTAAKPTSGLNKDKLTKDITEKLQSMLGLIDEEIDVTIPLRVYGLDSLTAMELTKWIESEMNIEFSQSQLLGDDITTEDLINIIMDGSSSAPVTESTQVTPVAPVVAPMTQARTFQQAPVATPVAPVAVQTRTFQPTPVAAPVAVQARSTPAPVSAPVSAPVAAAKPTNGINKDKLTKDITEKLQSMLGLIDEEIDVTIPLRVYGLDSLTAMELTKWIESEMNIEFSQSQLLGDDITTEDLINIIMDGSSSTSVTESTPVAPVVAPITQTRTFQPTPVAAPVAPVAVQTRSFQQAPVATPVTPVAVQTRTFQPTPVAAPVAVQARSTPAPVSAPVSAPVTAAKPTSGLNKDKLTKDITEKLQSMLGLIDEEIDVTIPLRVYGLDSLTAMELTKWIESEMNIEFSQSQLLGDDITTEDLINIIMDGSSSAPVTESTQVTPVAPEAPVVAPITQTRTFQPTPVAAPVAPVAVQTRSFQQAPVATPVTPVAVQTRTFQPTPVAAPVAVQARSTSVPAPAPVAAAKPTSGINKDKLTKDITEKLQSMLGLIDEEIDVTIPLRVYGLDSLTAMELTKWIESEMNIEFNQSQLLGDDITTEDLINIIMDDSSSTQDVTLAPVAVPTSIVTPAKIPVISQSKTFQTTPVAAPIPKPVPVRNFKSTPVTTPVVAPTTRPVPARKLQSPPVASPIPKPAPKPVPVRNFQSTPVTAPRALPVATSNTQIPIATVKRTSGLNKDKLTKDITEKLQSMLGLIDEEIDVTIPLRVYGLDSLTAMELTKWIESEMNIEFSQSQLLGDDITTEDLINIIMDGSSSAPVTESTQVAPAITESVASTPVKSYQPTPVTVRSAPVVAPAPIRSFQSTPVTAPNSQVRSFQPTPVAAPVAVQARSTLAPAPVAASKPTSGLNKDKLTKDITEKLQSMLGLIDEEIDVTIPLRVYGLDSLTAMELTKWIESEMNIEFSQSQLLGDDITTEDLINIIMDGSPATSAPVAAPIVKDTMASITPVVPTNFNVLPVEVHSSVDPLYQNISSIQKSTSMVTPDSVALKNEICDRLQNMLGLVDEKIDPAIPLRVYGLDSLTTMELTNWIQSELKVTLPQSQLLSDEITTNELVSIIINLLANNNNNNNGTNFYNAPSNNNSLDFNDVSNSKPVSSIADSESTFDASLVNQYNPAHETIITDDLLKKRSAFSGNKQELVRALKNEVVEKLQDLLGLVDENIDTNVPLQVYGLDSLTSMEIVKWVENDKKVELPQSALLSSEITTEELVNMIASKITGEDLVKAPSYDQYMDNELLI
ncbi:hypothetical protein LY90DRAFT_512986 [Neocallimastix californiae]|uniref:Uncharacterized protein n=1 Tax=Neocallimastix californiae TaxID=1754190 RepID=A0A1Y2B2M7_9FUNG|nr:hypothetical protein LY90DRAFT_512986 [Neocallimastix californiae]|eukprot:ORY29072.1 hypothetical protein LY90DRAFT_512986 [Neocallimastix californiae]